MIVAHNVMCVGFPECSKAAVVQAAFADKVFDLAKLDKLLASGSRKQLLYSKERLILMNGS